VSAVAFPSVPIAQELERRLRKLESDRASWDSRWQEIAERALPQHAVFQHAHATRPPDRRVERIFDATAGLALRRFSAVLESLLTPKQARWHSLKPIDGALENNYRVKLYLEEARNVLFKYRYASKSGFASQISEVFTALGSFGTAPFLIEEEVGKGIRYRSIHLAETYLCTDHRGMVDAVFRKFRYTARQAYQRYGDRLPEKVARVLATDPDKEFWFLHVVQPAGSYVPGVLGPRGFAYDSFHICLEDKSLVGSGGFRVMPYAVPRFEDTGTPYGWCPALLVLPEVKTANEQRRTLLRQGQLAVDPPILVHGDSGVLEAFHTRPGAINFNMVSPEGKQLAIPFQTGARLAEGREELAESRATIRAAFLNDLFQILIQKPNMTATEVLEWSQEKGDLLAPMMGKQQSELLGPCIERELDILAAMDVLPEMPRELAEAGGGVRIEFEGPMSRFQRSTEAAGFSRTVETLTAMIQLYPDVMDNFDRDEVLRSVADINGVPISWLLPPEAIAQQRAQRAQAQQQAMAAEQLPGQAAAAKSMAQAKQIGQAAA
jgi:hypothetical protein